MSEQSKESTAPAKGVAVVEPIPGDDNHVRIARDGEFFSLGAMQFYGTQGAYYPFELKDRDIAEAVAAAINARESKPSLSDRIADADTARDAKVSARLAADMDIDTERAQAIADAFRPFVDLQLKLALKKHRDELEQRLNGMENDHRESRQAVANQLQNLRNRIDGLRIVDAEG